VPGADGWLRAHDLLTGTVLWERRLGGAPGEPLVVGDRLYVGATDKQFYCLDAADGGIEWVIRVGAAVQNPASSDGQRIFVAAFDNLVRAVDRNHGGLLWQRGVSFRALRGPVSVGSLLFIAGPSTQIRVLRAVDGGSPAAVSFPEMLGVAPGFAAVSDGVLIAALTGSLTESWKLSLAAYGLGAATSAGSISARPLR
jgi:outer membrane protein assembly factor BamB